MGAVGAPSPPPAPTICLHCLPHHTALKTAIRQKGSNWVCLGNDFCPCPRDAHSTTRLPRQAEMDVSPGKMPGKCHPIATWEQFAPHADPFIGSGFQLLAKDCHTTLGWPALVVAPSGKRCSEALHSEWSFLTENLLFNWKILQGLAGLWMSAYPVNTGFPSSDCGGLLLSGRTAFTKRHSPHSLKLLITTQ